MNIRFCVACGVEGGTEHDFQTYMQGLQRQATNFMAPTKGRQNITRESNTNQRTYLSDDLFILEKEEENDCKLHGNERNLQIPIYENLKTAAVAAIPSIAREDSDEVYV